MKSGLSKGILVLALILFTIFTYMFSSFTIDDAYISFRYSENWINGDGLTWNAGDDPVEGYSNFLWVVLAGIILKLGVSIEFGIKLAGIILALLNLILIYKIAKEITKSDLWSSIVILFTAATPAFGFWAVGALENHLFMFFLYLGIYLLFNELKHNSYPYSAAAFAGAAMTRHEGAVLFVATLIFLALRQFDLSKFSLSCKKEDLTYWFKSALTFGIIYTPYFIWRVQYYGYFFPNTYYAKAIPGAGINEITNFLWFFWPFLVMALFALIKFKDGLQINLKREYVYFWMITLLSLFLLINRDPIMGNYHRFYIHFIPLVYILCVPLWKSITHAKHSAIWIILLLILIPMEPHKLSDNYTTYDIYSQGLEDVHVMLGKWINQRTPEDITLAITDAGAVPFYAKRRTIDLWGLNDENIAHNGFDLGYFWSQNPDVIVLFSTSPQQFLTNYQFERQIFLDPYFRENFEQVRTDTWDRSSYNLITFARKELNLTRFV